MPKVMTLGDEIQADKSIPNITTDSTYTWLARMHLLSQEMLTLMGIVLRRYECFGHAWCQTLQGP
eukprot:3104012-Prymnesium_polylepis.1